MVAEVLSQLKIYQAICWPLFPCSEKDKSPLTPHGFKDASLDLSVIAGWAERFPGCAWGVPTTAERAVLDIDPRNGGNESLERLVAEHGELPETPMTATGGGGLHFWLSFPTGTRCGKLAPGIDRKAIGGYVIVPPSRILIPEHGGRPYRFIAKPWAMEIVTAPPWLALDTVKTPKADRVGGVPSADVTTPISAWVVGQPLDFRTHPGGKRGELWGLLTRMLGTHLGRGDHPDDVRRWAEEWVRRSEQWDETPDWWRVHVEGMIKREWEKREAGASARQLLPALSLPAVPLGVGSPEETGACPPPRSWQGQAGVPVRVQRTEIGSLEAGSSIRRCDQFAEQPFNFPPITGTKVDIEVRLIVSTFCEACLKCSDTHAGLIPCKREVQERQRSNFAFGSDDVSRTETPIPLLNESRPQSLADRCISREVRLGRSIERNTRIHQLRSQQNMHLAA